MELVAAMFEVLGDSYFVCVQVLCIHTSFMYSTLPHLCVILLQLQDIHFFFGLSGKTLLVGGKTS